MDSDTALDKVEAQARKTTSTLATVKRGMDTWAAMSSQQPDLKKILTRLGDQSTAFNSTLKKSTTMFKSSAQTAKQVQELLANFSTIDAADLEKLADTLAQDVQSTASQVKTIYEELRKINSDLNAISRDVTGLEAKFEEQKKSTQVAFEEASQQHDDANHDAASTHRRKGSMLKGLGWGTIVLLCICWPAIPFWCCYTASGAVVYNKQEAGHEKKAAQLRGVLDSLTTTIELLLESEEKANVVRGALPGLVEGFNGMYDFYTSIDVQVKGLGTLTKGKGKLTYKAYAGRWKALHKQLEEHHNELQLLE